MIATIICKNNVTRKHLYQPLKKPSVDLSIAHKNAKGESKISTFTKIYRKEKVRRRPRELKESKPEIKPSIEKILKLEDKEVLRAVVIVTKEIFFEKSVFPKSQINWLIKCVKSTILVQRNKEQFIIMAQRIAFIKKR